MTAQNYNQGKMRPSLVLGDMPNAFNEMVKLREAGATKYDRMNWAESINTDDAKRFLAENLDSILRHLLAMYNGEEVDAETGCHHASSVAVRACFALEYWAQSNGSASEVRGSYQEPQGSDCVRSYLTDPSNLYDWADIPTPYEWAATDEDGKAWYYTHEPIMEADGWGSSFNSRCIEDRPDLAESWQDSLEERPKK